MTSPYLAIDLTPRSSRPSMRLIKYNCFYLMSQTWQLPVQGFPGLELVGVFPLRFPVPKIYHYPGERLQSVPGDHPSESLKFVGYMPKDPGNGPIKCSLEHFSRWVLLPRIRSDSEPSDHGLGASASGVGLTPPSNSDRITPNRREL